MTTFRDLPHDVLFNIIEYFDSESQLVQVGLVSKFMSHICFQKLWHTPLCKSILALKLLISTLNESDTMYAYGDWFMGLIISLDIMQTLPPELFRGKPFPIKTLQLVNVHASIETSQEFINLFITNNIRELILVHCSNEILTCLASNTAATRFDKLNRICIEDCHVLDRWVRQITGSTPQLRYFSSQRSGYIMSDSAIIAITQNCPLIETLIVTLPNHIIQSNTITMISLQSLATHCHYLKRFICRGQVRIATRECQDWLYANCPCLEYCDLSF